ncbi:MAG: class I tRNA ligase family protein, partial [Methanosarcinales archaeon]|nr:class I tRNA ligase family protein [Methanosarcinales archaeon]
PQGHDIIRTWAFYTILRSQALVGTRPWDSILINGMVLGEDGHKMSKSLNNFISPEEVFEKYGADALRQWAAIGGTPGSDVMFRWKDVVSGSRFHQKLWSIYRFSAPFAKEGQAEPGQVDSWLLAELNNLVYSVTDAMERFQFDEAFRAVRVFTWEVLADEYIELVKARLYGEDGPARAAAQSTLYTALDTVSRLMAPFIPFISEELYSGLTGESVHQASWPRAEALRDVDPAGLLIKDIAAAIRRYKSDRGIALNAPLSSIRIFADRRLETTDLQGVANSPVEARVGKPDLETRPAAVKPVMKVIGPRFKGQAGALIKALTSIPAAEIESQMASGSIAVDGQPLELLPEMVEVVYETLSGGQAVDVLQVGEATVLVRR